MLSAMVAILKELKRRNNLPRYITVETNGTQPITPELRDLIFKYQDKSWEPEEEYDPKSPKFEWFWSVSPKLWSTSGEKPSKAIKPKVVAEYSYVSNVGQLKYVVNGSPNSWQEVEQTSTQFQEVGVDWDIYIMGVGATKESQEENRISQIALEAMKRGYHFSGRLHCYVFGNRPCT